MGAEVHSRALGTSAPSDPTPTGVTMTNRRRPLPTGDPFGGTLGGCRRRAAIGKPATNREVDRNAIQEILGDLETRLEVYLVEWQRELGLRGVSEVSIGRTEQLPAATGRQKEPVDKGGSTK